MRRVWILNDLYVAETARRRGVGRMLHAKAEEFARETAAARVELVTQIVNEAAKRLYSSCGYEVDTEFQRLTRRLP